MKHRSQIDQMTATLVISLLMNQDEQDEQNEQDGQDGQDDENKEDATGKSRSQIVATLIIFLLMDEAGN